MTKEQQTPTFNPNVAEGWNKEKPGEDLSDFVLSICFSRLGRIIDGDNDKVCRKEFGVRGADVRVLFALRRSGPPYALRPSDLFRLTLVTSGAVTKQVDRLQAEKLVHRLPDPRNGGGNLVQLTKEGYQVTDKIFAYQRDNLPISKALRKCNHEEVKVVMEFCQTLLEDLNDPQFMHRNY